MVRYTPPIEGQDVDIAPGPFTMPTLLRGSQPSAPAPAPRPPAGPQVVDVAPPVNTTVRAVNPYSTVLPPLSPQMLEAIEERRAQSLRRLQEEEARIDSFRQRAELENIGRLLDISEQTNIERREGLAGLASRGVARSPMFANPFRRELARQQQRQIGESQRQLVNTLDQLQAALQTARQRREEEMSQLAFDELRERSSIQRLLGLE